MSQEIFGLLVRIEATTAGLRAELNRAKKGVDDAAGAFDKGARKAEASIDRMHQAAAKSARLSTSQLNTLKYTASDIIASLGSGMSPMTILLQQGPQVAQAFSLSFSAAGLAVGTVAAATLTAVAAMESYRSSVRAVDLAHRAMGGHLGVTRGDLEALAQQAAEAGDVSVRAAREQIETYTRTGQIGTQVMGGLIRVSKEFATATGVNATEAVSRLAKLFADPKAGAAELTKELRLLGDAEIEHVNTLVDANKTQEAQLYVLEKVTDRVKGMRGELGLLSGAWDAISRAASAVWNATGSEVSNAVFGSEDVRVPGQPNAEETKLQKRIAELEQGAYSDTDTYHRELRQSELATLRAQLEVETKIRQEKDAQVEAAAKQAAETARLKAESLKVSDIVKQAGGGKQAQEITLLEQQIKLLNDNANNPEVGPNTRAGEAMARERLQHRLDGLKEAEFLKVDLETYKRDQMSAAVAFTKGMKPEEAQRYLSQRQAEIEQIGSLTTELEREAGVRQATTQVEVSQFQARQQMTDGLRLQVDAQNRLADAAGKGEAAQRAANAETEIAAASYRSAAEGAAQRAAAVELEAATRRQIAAEQNAELDEQIIHQQRLNAILLAGPEAVRDLTIREQARTLALREAAEGTDAYNAALDRYLGKLRQLSAEQVTGNLQGMVDSGNRRQRDDLQRLGMIGMPEKEQAKILARMGATEELRRQGITSTKDLTDEQKLLVEQVYAQADAQAEVAYQITQTQQVYDELEGIVDQSFDRIGSAITEAFAQGEIAAVDFKNIGRAVVSELMQEFIKLAAINPIKNALFGTALSTLGSVGTSLSAGWTHGYGNVSGGGGTFGGTGNGPQFRASGGPVEAGMPYIVGEAGKEVFVPSVSGRILPSVPTVSASGGGAAAQPAGDTIHVNLNVSTGVAATVRAELSNMLPAITQATKAAVADSRQRGGSFSRAVAGR